MRDTIIVGVGPAGIQAALYLKGFGFDVLVLGKDYGFLTKDDYIVNFYSQEKISGYDLIDAGVKQAIKADIDVIMDPVLNILNDGDNFIVKTEEHTYNTKTVLLATGKVKSKMTAKGYDFFRGKGIHHCATCDGFFYRNKRIAIVGSGPYLREELELLKRYTNDIIVFTEGKSCKITEHEVVFDNITEFIGNDRITHINTNNHQYKVDGVFIALDFPVASELALKLGLIMEDENISVNKNMETNVKGVFAAGDCIGGNSQIVKTLNDGLKASLGILDYLK